MRALKKTKNVSKPRKKVSNKEEKELVELLLEASIPLAAFLIAYHGDSRIGRLTELYHRIKEKLDG